MLSTLRASLVALVLLAPAVHAQPVDDENHAPDCSAASASVDTLWPPNHKLVEIAIGGVTDVDGDLPDVTVVGVTQDEPMVGTGDGDACPDASGVGLDETVSLSAERRGDGDGRVYHVSFIADDGAGGTCSGEVVVCVPHDQGQGAACADGGPLVDSTGGPILCDGEACDANECEPLVPDACEGEDLPARVRRRLDRAAALLEQAVLADLPEQEVRARLRAAKLYRRASAAAVRAAAKGGLGSDCGAALAQELTGAGTCAACLLPPE